MFFFFLRIGLYSSGTDMGQIHLLVTISQLKVFVYIVLFM